MSSALTSAGPTMRGEEGKQVPLPVFLSLLFPSQLDQVAAKGRTCEPANTDVGEKYKQPSSSHSTGRVSAHAAKRSLSRISRYDRPDRRKKMLDAAQQLEAWKAAEFVESCNCFFLCFFSKNSSCSQTVKLMPAPLATRLTWHGSPVSQAKPVKTGCVLRM